MSRPAKRERYRHPNSGDLYTPLNLQVLTLFQRMRDEHGSWRRVAALSETRLKVLRNLRASKRKAISQTLLDRMITGTGVGSIREFEWFTAEDLVALGVWKPIVFMAGEDRVLGDDVYFSEGSGEGE